MRRITLAHIAFSPAQCCAIAQPQTRIDAQGQQGPQFALGLHANLSQFIQGKLAPAVGDQPLPLDFFPGVFRESGLALHHPENQREQIQGVCCRCWRSVSVIHAAGVFFRNLLCHVAQGGLVGVLLFHPVSKPAPLAFVLIERFRARVGAIW